MDALPIVSGRPKDAAEALFAANLGLVGFVLSRRFAFLTEQQEEDLLPVARLALWQAASRFNPARGVRFSSFAVKSVTGAVLNHLRSERAQAHLPCTSLETPVGDDGTTLGDFLEDEQGTASLAALLDTAAFESRISGCSGRQKALLRAMYGDPMDTLTEIGARAGVTRGAASSIHRAALQRLRSGTSPADSHADNI